VRNAPEILPACGVAGEVARRQSGRLDSNQRPLEPHQGVHSASKQKLLYEQLLLEQRQLRGSCGAVRKFPRKRWPAVRSEGIDMPSASQPFFLLCCKVQQKGVGAMSLKLTDLIASFLKFSAQVNAAATVDYYRRILNRFAEHLGDVCVDQVKPFHLQAWGKTWHRVQAVQRLFSWAANDAEVIPFSCVARVKKPRAGRRRRTLSRQDLARLLRKADKHFRPFLVTLRETIARPQEIRALRWEYLHAGVAGQDLAEALREGSAFFVLEEFKSRERRADPDAIRLIVLSPRVCRLLLRRLPRPSARKGFIFTNKKNQQWSSNAVRLRMRRLRKILGWQKDHRGEAIVAYSLRHTGATEATAAGVTDRLLADLMGQTSTRTTARYQHPQIAHLRAALAKAQRHTDKAE
jgi:integrase